MASTEIAVPNEVAAAVAEKVALKAKIADLQERVDQLDATILPALPGTGSFDVNGTKVTVREYTRVNYDRLTSAFPASTYPTLYVTKTVIDQAAVKKQFAPDALAEYTDHGKKSVSV